jgi:hypothetical protein
VITLKIEVGADSCDLDERELLMLLLEEGGESTNIWYTVKGLVVHNEV